MSLPQASLVIYKGRPALAEAKGDRLELSLAGGEKLRVRPKDVFSLYPGPADLDLKPPEGEEVEAWELLQGQTVSLKELAELVYGVYTPQAAYGAYLLAQRGERFVLEGERVRARTQEEFAAWHGVRYALAHNTGTAALHAAMFGAGVGHGDEILCPSLTYWASALPALSLGATVTFVEVDPQTLTVDPEDIEHRITPRTKAIVVVHYCGYPCEMDPIIRIAERYGVKVIEDVSHAHGGLYLGRLLGTIGHVGAMSCMSGKALPIGEGGMLITDDPLIYQRAVAFGHYERHATTLEH
ncbi:MAG: aminotransferase class V-fold PLP-dependent enzyme, partial [Meiothermus silvanus]|nr:aminotransferase class V-fold PLP-dependent enzyme [Allomeiothermus silvanus]